MTSSGCYSENGRIKFKTVAKKRIYHMCTGYENQMPRASAVPQADGRADRGARRFGSNHPRLLSPSVRIGDFSAGGHRPEEKKGISASRVEECEKMPGLNVQIMAVSSALQSKSVKKYVLQQSNCNLDASHDREDEHKLLEKNAYGMKTKEDAALETENQCNPQKVTEKPIKSDAKKLRSVRLDLSSLKRGVIQKANLKLNDFSSEESSEDETKSRRKPRPVVPNYVTNTESGPCRKPRQSRQDPLLLSSQLSPKPSPQSLSIARRNARERNRVKQVNEGFATLRSRIPDYISEAYNEEKGRKSAKKLSKVETLRMAVDYIRHLETLLDLKSTEKDVWMKQIKIEDQPWDTPSSADYLSPKYQPPCVDSPGTAYDQTFEYQDRIFYDYDLDFMSRKEGLSSDKKAAAFVVLGINGNETENQCVDDFKYYETFNRIKKEGSEDKTAEGEEELESVDASSRESHSLPKDVIKKVPKKSANVLPSITESFNKTIPVFF